jgi:hypothetical protein
LEQCVSHVDCWFSFIVYLCHQEYYPLLHSAGIPFTVSLSTQRLCQVPAYTGCLPIRHIRHAQERDKLATCVRRISNRPIWFRLRCSVEGWQLFTRYLIKNNGRVARNCFVDGLQLSLWKWRKVVITGSKRWKWGLHSAEHKPQLKLFMSVTLNIVLKCSFLSNITLVASSVFCICCCIWNIHTEN